MTTISSNSSNTIVVWSRLHARCFVLSCFRDVSLENRISLCTIFRPTFLAFLPKTFFFMNFRIFVAEICQTVFFWILKSHSLVSGKRHWAKCYDFTNMFSFFPFLQSHTQKKIPEVPPSQPPHPRPYIPQEWLNFVSALKTGSILQ